MLTTAMRDKFARKKVLVTGGAGVIGRPLVRSLVDFGATVRVVDMVEKPLELEGVEYLQADLARPDTQFTFRFDPEYIFHLAADFERSTESREFWESNYRNNVLCSHHVLREVTRLPSVRRLVFASSYLIYNKALYTKVYQPRTLREDDAIDPRNLTGLSKLQTEMDAEFLARMSDHRFTAISARIFRVYGPGSRDVISRWIRSALAGEPITVFSPDNRFDYVYADDVAQGLIRLGALEVKGVVNLASGQVRAVAEVVEVLRGHFPDLRVEWTEDVIQEEASQGDLSRFEEFTGWRPGISLEEGIARVIEHERARR
jgi:nucleoside-diphosphate-sugar epimerase